jgi:hypothetical protein
VLAYKLNQNIDGEKLLKSIQQLVQKSVVDQSKEYLLVIKIENIAYDENSAIPKLEYKHLDRDSC